MTSLGRGVLSGLTPPLQITSLEVTSVIGLAADNVSACSVVVKV